jgi:hypothetical protein
MAMIAAVGDCNDVEADGGVDGTRLQLSWNSDNL